MPRFRTPYDGFAQISKDFAGEMDFRMRSACRAIEILADYKNKVPKTAVDYDQFKSIRYIMARFAVLEICAAFDSNGQWSLRLGNRRGKLSVPPSRLKKLFPQMPAKELSELQGKLDYVVRKNSALINRLLHTRHKRIAHAGHLSTKFDARSLSSLRFPKARCYKLAYQIHAIMMETCFGIPLDWKNT